MQPNFIISLLVYNQLEVTKKCIKSVLENTRSNYLLVISDNASKEETAGYLASLPKKYKNIVYVRNDENLGFITAHNNIFDKYKRADYFCVLNNDIIINSRGWDRRFLEILQDHPKIAQVGPRQDHGYIDNTGVGRERSQGESLDYLGGHCFVVRSRTAREVGGLFDNKNLKFAFCEDADLSLRLRSKGHQILELENVNVTHLHHKSFREEKVAVDYKRFERENQQYLHNRWGYYLTHRTFGPEKILVIRTGALGDTFCTEPVIRALKQKYSGSTIDLQTVCPQGFENNPYISNIGNDLNKGAYDLVLDLDLAYEKQPLMHMVDAYADAASVVLEDKIPRYYGVSNTEKEKGVIAVNSEGSWASRTWNMDRWKNFITYLSKNYKIKEVGTSNYLGIGENYVGKLSLKETVQIITNSEMYVGFDGGLMHFAQAVGTPVFIIFGCTCPTYRIHDWSKARVVWQPQNKLECAGCHHWREAPRCFTECDKPKVYCLENITEEMVISQFEKGEYNSPPKGLI